jgi:hypothetical protein
MTAILGQQFKAVTCPLCALPPSAQLSSQQIGVPVSTLVDDEAVRMETLHSLNDLMEQSHLPI